MTMRIDSLTDRPDLAEAHGHLADLWPEFMLHDPAAELYFGRLEAYSDHVFLATDHTGRVVARALSVPVAMGPAADRPSLPAAGWDGIIRWAWQDHLLARPPTHLSALEVTIVPEHRGHGLAQQLLERMRTAASHLDLAGLVAPVRPSRKHHEPRTPMATYAARTRDDRLPEDPWLRLHVRAGGRIAGVCPYSMTIPGTLDQWRSWLHLPLESSGKVDIPGGLVPLHVDLDQQHAVYIEPNVWIIHD